MKSIGMKKIKSILALFLIAVCALNLSSCGSSKKGEGEYTVYYPDYSGESMLSKKVSYRSDAGAKKTVNYLIGQIKDNDEMALPDEIEIKGTKINSDNKELTIDFASGYRSLTGYKETILRASIVKTVLQVKGIKTVSFSIDGQALTDANGTVVGPMSADTFIEDFGKDQAALITKTVKLYYAYQDGKSLVAVARTLHYGSSTGLEQTIVNTLSKAPYESDLRSAYSDSSKILNVSVSDGICFLDIDSSFFTDMAEVSQDVALYSLVNSLTEVDGINKVSVTVYTSGTLDTTNSFPTGNFEKNLDIVSADESGMGD